MIHPRAAPLRLYPGLLRNVAVAHIVTGYRQRQPTYIKMAASIIKHAMSSGKAWFIDLCKLIV